AELLDRFHRAVDRDPRHHLRMGEMAPRPAHFPEALVGLAPDLFQVLEQRALHVPGGLVGGDAELARLVERIHQLAVDVELQLRRRGIADAQRRRALPAAAFPTPPAAAPGGRGSEALPLPGTRPSPATPYMICIWLGAPAT